MIEADEDIQSLVPSLSIEEVWSRPGGAASVGYHVRHAMGSLDRLFTYARDEALSETQLAALAAEKNMDRTTATPSELAADFSAAVDRALKQLRVTPQADVLAPRAVGRAKATSNVLDILMHAAGHTYRHVGQAITTAKIVKGA